MLGALRVATTAKHLELVISLDDRIDQVARLAASQGTSDDPEKGDSQMSSDAPALVIGDEMRLRQVVTVRSSFEFYVRLNVILTLLSQNLASNACKFSKHDRFLFQ